MRIAINFGDNDFYNTLMPFIKIIMDAVQWNPYLEQKLTKEHIVELFNNMAFSLYRMFQNSWEHSIDYEESTEKHLKINVNDVYIGDEIDEKFKTVNSWANHAFFYVDTDNCETRCF